MTSVPGLALLKQTGVLTAAARGNEISLYDGFSGAGLTALLLKRELPEEAKIKIVLGDKDENMVSLVQSRIEREMWTDVEARVMDANVRFLPFFSSLPPFSRWPFLPFFQALPLPAASFDYVTLNCGPQLAPDYEKTFSGSSLPSSFLPTVPHTTPTESVRILKSGGTLGYTAWTSLPFFSLLTRVDPSFVPSPNLSQPPYLATSAAFYLTTHFPLTDVVTSPCSAYKSFENAEQCVENFKEMMTLFFSDEERNDRVAELLKSEHGDGSFELEWKALIVTAKKA
jgi:hypothetical protein